MRVSKFSLFWLRQSQAGKSSLISVLSRAYDVQEGTVLVNGVDIKMLNSAQLAGSIAVLPQSAELFEYVKALFEESLLTSAQCLAKREYRMGRL